MKRLLAGLLASTLAIAPLAAADLEVTVERIRNGTGEIRLALYEREEGFRKEQHARQLLALPAKAGSLTTVFRELPPGRYAVIAYHDENGDGKLNLRFGMFPLEGYGLSNNPELSGPPKFRPTSFELPEQGARISLDLKY